MTIKKIILNLSIIAIPPMIFCTSLFTVIPLVTNCNYLQDYKNKLLQTEKVNGSIVVNQIESANVAKSGWNWPGEELEDVGYHYNTFASEQPFSLDNYGFNYDKSFPAYSMSSLLYTSQNIYLGEISGPLKVQTQSYDPTTGNVGTYKTLLSGLMKFGGTSNSNL